MNFAICVSRYAVVLLQADIIDLISCEVRSIFSFTNIHSVQTRAKLIVSTFFGIKDDIVYKNVQVYTVQPTMWCVRDGWVMAHGVPHTPNFKTMSL